MEALEEFGLKDWDKVIEYGDILDMMTMIAILQKAIKHIAGKIREIDKIEDPFEQHPTIEDMIIQERKENHHSSWMSGSYCRVCGHPVVMTQPTEPGCDYWWYCSNKKCEQHHPGEQTGDQEMPHWVSKD